MSIVAGIDFGTNSVRVSIVDSDQGRLGSGIATYDVQRRADDVHHASQRSADHERALVEAMRTALSAARVDGRLIASLAVATTSSTVVPVDEHLAPIDDYYLWCDHRAWREADRITEVAREMGLEALAWSGGQYLSEFGWAKLLHWLRNNPNSRERFATALEHCDWMTAKLCGIADFRELTRGVCAMGHKWMWNASLGGLPSAEFLASVDPLLTGVRENFGNRFATSDTLAGELCDAWAERLGLSPGIPIPVGGIDAHWDAIGVGIRLGDAVNVIGTSSCVMAIWDDPRPIPGVCGVVAGSIHPRYAGIEAGLSAAGDLFDAIARRAGTTTANLFERIEDYQSCQTGLLRLVWDNGDRTILGDPHLRGVTFGWDLSHTAADELFAAIEGTAYQTRIILERMAEHGVPVRRVINAGGISRKSAIVNQVYANALGTPVLVPVEETTSLGSAIFAFLAAGTFKSIDDAQQVLCPPYTVFEPEEGGKAKCQEIFDIFRRLYFSLGDQNSVPMALGQLLPTLQKFALPR